MNVDIISIMDSEGSEIAVSGEVNTSDYNITVNSRVSGKVVNFSGRLEFNADVSSVVSVVCARCLAPVTAELNFTISEVVGEEGITLNGTILDVGGIVDMYVFMNLPIKLVCSEACKGLCAGCGVNLNFEGCNCGGDEIDERLAALKKLLD